MKPWYKSIKLYALIMGVLFVIIKEYHLISPEGIKELTYLVMTFLGAQGMADFGKNKIQ